jgi:hypothetical protein
VLSLVKDPLLLAQCHRQHLIRAHLLPSLVLGVHMLKARLVLAEDIRAQLRFHGAVVFGTMTLGRSLLQDSQRSSLHRLQFIPRALVMGISATYTLPEIRPRILQFLLLFPSILHQRRTGLNHTQLDNWIPIHLPLRPLRPLLLVVPVSPDEGDHYNTLAYNIVHQDQAC